MQKRLAPGPQVNPRTYIGSGKVQEIMAAVSGTGATTVIFDDELSPGGRGAGLSSGRPAPPHAQLQGLPAGWRSMCGAPAPLAAPASSGW